MRSTVAFIAGVVSMLGVALFGLVVLDGGADGRRGAVPVSPRSALAQQAPPVGEAMRPTAEAEAQWLDERYGEQKVRSTSGELVGSFRYTDPIVQLPGGVTAHAVRNDRGERVGYMTQGDIGYVDNSLAADEDAFLQLVSCYEALTTRRVSGTPLDAGCRVAFARQGQQVPDELFR